MLFEQYELNSSFCVTGIDKNVMQCVLHDLIQFELPIVYLA
jgi:hypothetical protein